MKQRRPVPNLAMIKAALRTLKRVPRYQLPGALEQRTNAIAALTTLAGHRGYYPHQQDSYVALVALETKLHQLNATHQANSVRIMIREIFQGAPFPP